MSRPVESTDVLLVGGGVASVRCARTLRRAGFDGRIVLVGDEPIPPYNRPPLSKELLRDDLPDELVLAEPAAWYERREIERFSGRRVTALDAERREVALDDGTGLRFERCLLATGAEPRRLAIDGAEHALALRTLRDARTLRRKALDAGTGARVTVIGGSFIGIEVASGLAALGLNPTIVERGNRLWAGAVGEELDRWARERLAGSGIGVRTGASVTALAPDAAWIGDERVEHAFSIAGIGVAPRVELAAAAGLTVDDGIVTDAGHRTSHPAIWAAGDVARREGRRIEHWHSAREGGERAARAMLGLPIGPDPAPWLFSEVAGVALDVVGAAPAWDEERWIGEGVLAYAVNGRVAQLAAVGSSMPAERMRAVVGEGATVEDAVAAIG